jgi:hypothetical protein
MFVCLHGLNERLAADPHHQVARAVVDRASTLASIRIV